jgi:hypothetical protein
MITYTSYVVSDTPYIMTYKCAKILRADPWEQKRWQSSPWRSGGERKPGRPDLRGCAAGSDYRGAHFF